MRNALVMAGLAAGSLLCSLFAAEPPAVQDGKVRPAAVRERPGRLPHLPHSGVAVTAKGTVLAFCEGRKHSASDTGDIDLLVKRSTDHGRTWSQQHVLWDDAGNTCGNPCAVVERETGTIWLLTTWNRGDDHERRSSHKPARTRDGCS